MGGLSKLEGAADLVGRLAGQAPEPKLLTYNPGPGIYSRLERAVEAMPENVRVQELPGLLKRYKDGVPGWELKAVDLDSVVAGRDVVPRQEILAAVKERSPVYTHKEVVLGGRPQYIKDVPHTVLDDDARTFPFDVEDVQPSPAVIGRGVSHGDPKYEPYGQGGKDYTEVLLLQPGADGSQFGSHWHYAGPGAPVPEGGPEAVAHARFDVHDGYLRVNELQSDLGIHNRKQREVQGEYLESAGSPPPSGWLPELETLPFPLEDASSDLLLKRLNLYAAQNGLRGVEIASPRAIADKVGGNIANYEHAYGKVAVGNQQRLGRRLGGMAEEVGPQGSNAYEENLEVLRRAFGEPGTEALGLMRELQGGRVAWKPRGAFDPSALDRFDSLDHAYQSGMREQNNEVLDLDFEMRHAVVQGGAERLYATLVEDLVARGIDPSAASRQAAEAMPRLVRLAEEQAARNVSFVKAQIAPHSPPPPKDPKVVYRGTMSDEMRRRILLEGIPASVAGAIGTDQILDRLDKDSPQPQLR